MDAVVEGHPLHDAAQSLIVNVLVEAQLEGGLGIALGADESLLSDAHLGMSLAVHGHSAREPVVDARERLRQIVFLDFCHQVLECPGLMAQGVPVLGRHLDGDFQHPVEREVSVTKVNCSRTGRFRRGR